jgi:predicted HicB family RNase H-like nuclease
MKKPLIYKNYSASIEFDADDLIFVGHLTGITDIVSFHGESVSELIAAFESAVDGYIEMSEKLGIKPQKPFSGKLMLRISPEAHAKVAKVAEASGMSINAWLAELIQAA